MNRLTRAALALLAAVVTVLGVAPGAQAHPSGASQRITVSASGSTVRVVWKMLSPHEVTLLGVSLGLLPQDRVMLDGATDYEAGDEDVLAAAPEVVRYALEHVRVSTDAGACQGSTPGGKLLTDGITLTFACRGQVRTATVEAHLLTDVNPAYEALGTGPDGQHAVFSEAEPSHEWTLGEGPSRTPWIAGGGAVVLLAAAAGAVAARLRSRQRRAPREAPGTPLAVQAQ